MSVNTRSPIVTNGLVLALDAGSRISYPGSGTTWNDLSGYATNPTLINGPTFNPSDGSIIFDGTNDAAIINNPNLSMASGTKTILCWCWPDSTGPNDTYIGLVSWGGRSNANPSNTILLSLNTNGSTCFVSSAYWYNDFVPNNTPVQENDWNLVGIIARQQSIPNSNNTTLFSCNRNGLNFTTGNSSDVNRSINTSNVNLAIASTDYTGRRLKGKIASVMVYNRELSQAEIIQNFNNTKTRFGL